MIFQSFNLLQNKFNFNFQLTNVIRHPINGAFFPNHAIKYYCLPNITPIHLAIQYNPNLTPEEKQWLLNFLAEKEQLDDLNYSLGPEYICPMCNYSHYSIIYCDNCMRMLLRNGFEEWNSGSQVINRFIQKCQMGKPFPKFIVEWIPFEDFIGVTYKTRGGFGEVFTAIWNRGRIVGWDMQHGTFKRQPNVPVVMKSVFNSRNPSEDFIREALQYLEMKPDRRYIVDFYGLSRDPTTGNYIIVMPFMEKGDLRHFLQSHHHELTWKNKFIIISQISKGLSWIHQKGLIHKNLHSGNILRSNLGVNRISDLGFCGPAEKLSEGKVFGIIPYMAPEILLGGEYTNKSDIYSLGMIIWEIISGWPPFNDRAHDHCLVSDIISGERPPILDVVPESLRKLINLCWNSNSIQRPDASEVSEFAEVALKKIYQVLDNEFDQMSQGNSVECPEKNPSAFHFSRVFDTREFLQPKEIQVNLPTLPIVQDHLEIEPREDLAFKLSRSSSYDADTDSFPLISISPSPSKENEQIQGDQLSPQVEQMNKTLQLAKTVVKQPSLTEFVESLPKSISNEGLSHLDHSQNIKILSKANATCSDALQLSPQNSSEILMPDLASLIENSDKKSPVEIEESSIPLSKSLSELTPIPSQDQSFVKNLPQKNSTKALQALAPIVEANVDSIETKLETQNIYSLRSSAHYENFLSQSIPDIETQKSNNYVKSPTFLSTPSSTGSQGEPSSPKFESLTQTSKVASTSGYVFHEQTSPNFSDPSKTATPLVFNFPPDQNSHSSKSFGKRVLGLREYVFPESSLDYKNILVSEEELLDASNDPVQEMDKLIQALDKDRPKPPKFSWRAKSTSISNYKYQPPSPESHHEVIASGSKTQPTCFNSLSYISQRNSNSQNEIINSDHDMAMALAISESLSQPDSPTGSTISTPSTPPSFFLDQSRIQETIASQKKVAQDIILKAQNGCPESSQRHDTGEIRRPSFETLKLPFTNTYGGYTPHFSATPTVQPVSADKFQSPVKKQLYMNPKIISPMPQHYIYPSSIKRLNSPSNFAPIPGIGLSQKLIPTPTQTTTPPFTEPSVNSSHPDGENVSLKPPKNKKKFGLGAKIRSTLSKKTK
ncbi:hypothetical protein G9A89_001786 [Geosiphon pyriformis]|nr:hypothetical protein G9A89_001786 [Geosiphon pyriformis]